MGLLSFLKRDDGKGQAPLGAAATPDDVQRARTRARQRLIGAVVLLGIGIVGFPLLFETQPRPIAVDLPIEIPRKDGVPPLAVPPPRPAAQGRVAPAPATTPPAASAAARATEETPTPPAKTRPQATDTQPQAANAPPDTTPPLKPEPAKAESSPASPGKPSAEAARAQALLEGAASSGRYVVQVGAYAEEKSAREARLKVERLGLKTYTQVVDTGAGKRIRVRVGPYPSRDEADRAAGKLKSAGLPSAILAL